MHVTRIRTLVLAAGLAFAGCNSGNDPGPTAPDRNTFRVNDNVYSVSKVMMYSDTLAVAVSYNGSDTAYLFMNFHGSLHSGTYPVIAEGQKRGPDHAEIGTIILSKGHETVYASTGAGTSIVEVTGTSGSFRFMEVAAENSGTGTIRVAADVDQ